MKGKRREVKMEVEVWERLEDDMELGKGYVERGDVGVGKENGWKE